MIAMPPWTSPTTTATETSSAALLLAGVAAEVSATAPRAQQQAFFRAIGARIASTHPIEPVDDLGALATVVNRVWLDHGFGHVRFDMAEDGILITHVGAARNLISVLGQGTEPMVRPILEGVYDAWLRTLGSGNAVSTWTIGWNDSEVRLKHGIRPNR